MSGIRLHVIEVSAGDVLAPLDIEKGMRAMSEVRKLGKPMYMEFTIHKEGVGGIHKGLAIPVDALNPDGTPTYRGLLASFCDKWDEDKCERFVIDVRLEDVTDCKDGEAYRDRFKILRKGEEV